MRMQVILYSRFARPGSALIKGGKKGEFRDWTKENREKMPSEILGVGGRRAILSEVNCHF